MKASRFRETIDELYKRLVSLTETKGEEYKRREDNQFANFERGAHALGLTREQVLMVYLSKHLDSIVTYVKDRAAGQEKVYAEPISGRIDDAILYLLILRGMTVENDEGYGRRVARSLFPGEPFEAPEFVEHPNYLDRERVQIDPTRGLLPAVTVAVETIGGPLREIPAYCCAKAEGQGVNICGDCSEASAGYSAAMGPGAVTAPTFVISTKQTEALEMCDRLGIPRATSALSAVDQLHGVRPGAHVVVIHHGTRVDDALLKEVQSRADKQGLTHRVDYR